MTTRTPTLLPLLIALTTAAPSLHARADDNDYSEGSLGAGTTGSVTSEGTGAATVMARIGYKVAGVGKSEGAARPLHWLDAELTFNAAGVNEEGEFVTGLTGHFEGMVGGQLLGHSASGCGFYIAAGAQGEAAINFNRDYMNYITGYVGPESGILCQQNGVTVMASPTVGVGIATVGKTLPVDESETASDDGLFAGLRLRILVDEVATVSTSVNYMPDTDPNDAANDHYTVEANANTEIKPSKNSPWLIGARVKVIHFEPIAGAADSEDGNIKRNAMTGGQLTISASMAF